MLRIQRILISRDDSPCSEHALNEALWLAQQTGADLHILRVEVLLDEPMQEIEDPASEMAKVRERLTRVMEARSPDAGTFDPGSVPIFHRTVRGLAPAPAIVEYAGENGIDLIVIGTHGRRGVRRLLIGSVAEEVVRTAPCPVFTVRGPDDGEPVSFDSILVPFDYSEHAKDALRNAAVLAKQYDARLQLLHVLDEYAGPGFLIDEVMSSYDVREEIEKRAVEEMERTVQEVLGSIDGVDIHTVLGNAPTGILEFAEKNGTDLIVMSTHGLTGFKHLVMGSVAEKVVRQAPCPVLTIKAFSKSLIDPSEIAMAQVQ